MFEFIEPMHGASSTHTAVQDEANKHTGHLTVGMLQTGATMCVVWQSGLSVRHSIGTNMFIQTLSGRGTE